MVGDGGCETDIYNRRHYLPHYLHEADAPVVLLPFWDKDYRSIGLVEVVWKVVAAILNIRFTSSITYHDALHGFRAGRGTVNATLTAKLLQQLAAMREEILYVIFLDLTKVYDALERSRCLERWCGM